MPRGRHRHSPPLHRMLPPLTVAGSAAVLAAGAWFVGDPVVLRVLVATAAASACTGAVLLRSWDRAAGRQVAELTTARVRDEWRTDERIAELETDVEESREVRVRIEAKLRAKRSELGRLRTEHAALLRRYATAESDRARVMESRRRLELEAAATPLAIEPPKVGPSVYLRAAEALRNLNRNAARQQALRTVEEARRRDREADDERQGRHAAPDPADPHAGTRDGAVSGSVNSVTGSPTREHRLVPAVASAVLPYGQPNRSASANRMLGGFDFFGVQKSAAAHDLADVVGDEAYAEHEAEREADAEATDPEVIDEEVTEAEAAAEAEAEGDAHASEGEAEETDAEVIDLTEHDETEQLDVRELRAHS